MKTTKILAAILLGTLASPVWANGPAYDAGGNGNLANGGTYYFRQVIYGTDSNGDITEGVALNGSINFNSNGTYTVPAGATEYDYAGQGENGGPTSTAITGTFVLSQSGLGYMSSPLNGFTQGTDTVYFTLGRGGIVIGSSTEAGYNDLFIAAQQSSPLPSTGTFSGSWSMAGFLPAVYDYPTDSEDVFFQMNPNGAGSLGTVTVTGYIGLNGTTQQTQNSSNVKYTISTGAAVVTFPNFSNSTPFYSGQLILNFSADGNFVFGGMNGGFDMLVGVRNGTGGSQNFGGLYFQGGLDQDLSQYTSQGYASVDSYYGSFNAVDDGGNGVIFSHERISYGTAIGSTFADQYAIPAVSPYNDTAGFIQFAYGSDGLYRIGAGTFPYLGLSVAVQALPATGSGVFINPQAVVNTASYSPFTAGISAGEIVTIFGSNLSSSNTLSQSKVIPLATTLDATQVLVSGTPASLYYVSPTQISFIMPFNYGFQIAPIQVVNSNGNSNTVTEFVYTTTPGVFASGGLGYAAIVDATLNQIVTPSNPANPGDIVEVFATGLGNVSPAPVPDGAAASPNENTTADISAYVGGASATVSFAGLVPTLAALGQVNVAIPTTASGGTNIIELDGPDSATAQVAICISGASCTGGSARTPSDSAKSIRAMDVKRKIEAEHPVQHVAPQFRPGTR